MYNFYGNNMLLAHSFKHHNTDKICDEFCDNTSIDGLQHGIYVDAYCGAGRTGRTIFGTYIKVEGYMDSVVRLLEGNTLKS